MKTAILIGTSRPNNKSTLVARFIKETLSSIDDTNDFVLVDPKDFSFPDDGNDEPNKDPAYGKIVEGADSFIVVVPEYNHSFPGSLKRMLDSELSHYIHKPVSIVGVSAGGFGGVRAVQSLVPVLREIGMVTSFTDAYFSKTYEIFDEDGSLKEEFIESQKASLSKMYTELKWLSESLTWGRDNLKSEYHA